MSWKKIALRWLGPSFFVFSMAVMGVTLATVASVRADEPPCPDGCDDRMGCAGSLCECKQTSMGSGVWDCFQPNIEG
jgi:hypothetical protein